MNSHTSSLLKNSKVESSLGDPIVKEVRYTRHALAAQSDNNLQMIVKNLMDRQQKLGKSLREA